MKNRLQILTLCFASLFLPSVGCAQEENQYNKVTLANPASVNCTQQGDTLEIRTDEQGGQTGYCLFADGSECEEWAYFRGECKPGQEDADMGSDQSDSNVVSE